MILQPFPIRKDLGFPIIQLKGFRVFPPPPPPKKKKTLSMGGGYAELNSSGVFFQLEDPVLEIWIFFGEAQFFSGVFFFGTKLKKNTIVVFFHLN